MAFEILIIESSEKDRTEIGQFLETVGYQVHYATDSASGFKQYDEVQPDLVIVEVLLSGGMNGLKVCHHLKKQSPDWVKVIVTSKLYQSQSMSRDAVIKFKADVYLEKPFTLRDLFEHTRSLIGTPEMPKKPDQNKQVIPTSAHKRAKPVDRPKHEKPRKEITAKSRPDMARVPEKHEPFPQPEPQSGQADTKPKAQNSLEMPGTPMDSGEKLFDDGEGNLTRQSLARLLNTLFRKKISALLVLTYEQGTKHIYLVEGTPVFVQSNIRSESLGQILFSEGHINSDQYKIILEEAATTKKKIGAICVRNGFLTGKQLHEILTRQTVIKIAGCFAWDSGKYSVDQNKKYPPNAPIFEATPAQILLEAYHRHVPKKVMEKAFENDRNKIVFSGKDDIYCGLEKELNENEQAFVKGANGKGTLAELIQSSPLLDKEPLRLAYALLAMNVFKLGDVKRDEELDKYQPEPAVDRFAPEPHAALAEKINEMYMRLDTDDLYQILGVSKDAPLQELKRSYNKLQSRFNKKDLPDDTPKALLKKLNMISSRLEQAYQVLKDGSGKAEYQNQKELDSEVIVLPESPADSTITPEAQSSKKFTLVAELAYQKGLHAMTQGHFLKGIDFFKRAMETEPGIGDYHIQYGYAIFKFLTEQPVTLNDAFVAVKMGLAKSPGDVVGFKKLAQMYRQNKDYEKAQECILRIIELDSQDDEAQLELREINEIIEK